MVWAQDRVILVDGTVLEGKVQSVGLWKVHVDTGQVIHIPKKQVWKIEYAGGRVQKFPQSRPKLKMIPGFLGWRYYANDQRISRQQFMLLLSDDDRAFRKYLVGRRMAMARWLTLGASGVFIAVGVVTLKPVWLVAGGLALGATAYFHIASAQKALKAIRIYNRKIRF